MHPILKLVIQRLALGLLLLLAASVLIFVGTQILPGDVAQAVLGQNATPEALANMRASLGLDQPAYARYFSWLFSALHGDLGHALSNGRDIAESISGRMRNTLFLASVAAAISVPLAIFLGLLAVRYRDRWPDRLISAITLASISLPEFLLGYVIMYVFSVQLGWFPSIYDTTLVVNDWSSFKTQLQQMVMPVMVLALQTTAQISRYMRASMLDNLNQDYVRTARAKGLSEAVVVGVHVLRNSMIPVVTVIALNVPSIFGGAIITENVFKVNGIGQLLITWLFANDLPGVMTLTFIFAFLIVIFNLIADILYGILDPRIRYD